MVKRKADTSSQSRKKKNKNKGPEVELSRCSHHQFQQPTEVNDLRTSLLTWYDQNKRDLPWRRLAKDLNININERAYGVWVSEIMAQQTQISRVVEYYNRWIKKWPTVQDLAKAKTEEVDEVWSGLGYYSRGRRLHQGAVKVVEKLEGQIPDTADKLLSTLPGVGRYTAGAIASVAFGQVTGLVDGNVIRVFSRMRAIGADTTLPQTLDAIWAIAENSVDPTRPGDFNQALMELGATMCTPWSPSCDSCPVRQLCLAHSQVEREKRLSASRLLQTKTSPQPAATTTAELTDIENCADTCSLCLPASEPWDSSLGVQNYPRRSKKKAAREERYGVCVLYRDAGTGGETEYLLVQRPDTGLLANLWEFLNVAVDADATSQKCKSRILQHVAKVYQLDRCEIEDVNLHGEVQHLFSHIHHTYCVFSCRLTRGVDVQTDRSEASWKWVNRQQFLSSATSSGMKKVFEAFEGKKKGNQKAGTGTLARSKGARQNSDKKKLLGLEAFFKPRQKEQKGKD